MSEFEQEPIRVIEARIQITRQLHDQLKAAEDAWVELEWIILHYDKATPEQRARLNAFFAAQDAEDAAA